MHYQAVLFDMDGTLLNTLGDLHTSVNYAMAALGCPQISMEQTQSFVGNGIPKLLERALPAAQQHRLDEALSLFLPHYKTHMDIKTKPYPGILPLLLELRDTGIKVGVVSNKEHGAVQLLCKKYFPRMVDAAVGVGGAYVPKPDPQIVFGALEQLGVTPEKALFVGDSDVDVITAKNAGLPFLGCTWGFRTQAQLRDAGMQECANNADEILQYVLK